MLIIKTKATEILYSVFFVLCSFFSVVGQSEAPKVQFGATPTVAELAKYADTPVGYYSGAPNINIPLYTINTGSYNLPISLSYHAGGIKIAQEASWVGLGWSLNAGGMITRQIRGKDDFSRSQNDLGYFYNYENYDNPEFESVECRREGYIGTHSSVLITSAYYLEPNCNVKKDGEPDLFIYNFAGYSGKFFLQSKGQNLPGEGILIDKENNLKIEFYINGLDCYFIVTAPNGIKYEFFKKEKSKTIHRSVGSINGTNDGPEKIDSWLLDKIILTTGEEIKFNYKNDEYHTSSQETISENQEKLIYITPNAQCIPDFNQKVTKYTSTFYEEKYILDNIQWGNGNTIVFETDNRLDFGNGASQKLKNIIITDKEVNEIKKYNLFHSYFNDAYLTNTSTDRKQNVRLKLEKIQEVNTISSKALPPYSFSYYEDNALPSKISNNYDHWGFSNGIGNLINNTRIPTVVLPAITIPNFDDTGSTDMSSDTFLGAKRHAKLSHAISGTLKSIQYPTGGTVTYEYELNDYFLGGSRVFEYVNRSGNIQIDLNHEFPFVPYDGGQIQNPNFYDFEVIGDVPSYTLSYSINKEAYDITVSDVNAQPMAIELFKIVNGDEVSVKRLSHVGFESSTIWHPQEPYKNFSKTYKETLLPGNYRVRFTAIPNYFLNSLNDLLYMFGDISYSEEDDNLIVKSLKAGGLRIKRISSPSNVREFEYEEYNEDLDIDVSSGILFSKPRYWSIYSVEKKCGQTNLSSAVFVLLQSSSNYPITGTITGNIVGYGKVTEQVINQQDQSKIKTVYEYNNRKEQVVGFNVPNKNDITNNGKFKEVLKYNDSETLIEKTEYSYDEYFYDPILAFNYSSPTTTYQTIFATNYVNYTYWAPLNSKNIYTYDVNGNNAVVQSETYQYNLSMQHKNKISVFSRTSNDNKVLKTKFYYPEDIGSLSNVSANQLTAANKLLDNYQIDIPVQTEKYIYNESDKLLATNRIAYKVEGNIVVPEFFKTAIGNNSLENKIEYINYDDKGNILETKNMETGVHTTYIWGYNQTYPIAKIYNATNSQILALSEFSTLNISNGLSTSQETALRSHTSLKEAMVTTYTYKDLVGIASITDPRGKTTSYHYDSFNRLEYITDYEGKVVSKNEYHYKNQQ